LKRGAKPPLIKEQTDDPYLDLFAAVVARTLADERRPEMGRHRESAIWWLRTNPFVWQIVIAAQRAGHLDDFRSKSFS
jgi:hypothetical protein